MVLGELCSISFENLQSNAYNGFGSIVRSIMVSCSQLDIKDLERESDDRVIESFRKYGKGARLLGPFGYYHPSRIISIITDNAKRGRLTLNSTDYLYSYDFDANKEIVKIYFKDNATTTVCEAHGKIRCFLTYETYGDNLFEIVDVAIAKYDGYGILEAEIEIAFFDNMRSVGHVFFETYKKSDEDSSFCIFSSIVPSDESCHDFGCFENQYKIVCDEKKETTTYEQCGEQSIYGLKL